MDRQRLALEIHGAVQGVGFRPFVYRLASDIGLDGWILNDTGGVFIEVEGDHDQLARFSARLASEHPPRAVIHSFEQAWMAPAGYTGFEIRQSDEQGPKTALVLPDIATCPDCLRELFDPANRRYRYPFTNCTNCGPRFTIIEALPYDRPHTTMRGFRMCPTCQREYDSPHDRRFHAQPNACPVCGPQLSLQLVVAGGSLAQPAGSGEDALSQAVRLLREGQIVAVKGLGGFHLMADASNQEAVACLRERKLRREKPFALMVRDLTMAEDLCIISEAEAALLGSPEAPIVLMRRRPGAPIASGVAPGNPYLGLMLPATPLHHLLLNDLGFPLVATSGNLSDEPICIDEEEALSRLGQIADAFLVHDRPITRHVDDSIVALNLGEPRMLRRARGYAPMPVLLRREAPCVLAVGAHLKNTVALSVGRQVFISQHIGDMETPEARNAFERVIADFLRLYEARPVAIAHDMHPEYASTRFARAMLDEASSRSGAPISAIPVQHHHAHLAACLAENGVEGSALGVIWDGTGYGLDGTIWGGEWLCGDVASSQRVAHMRTFRLPGGDAAVREPRRTALALLWETFGPDVFERSDLPVLSNLGASERQFFGHMLRSGLNAPITSSAGRLFDGIAALIGLRGRVSYEGQAAMELEWCVDTRERGIYPFALAREGQSLVIDWRPMVALLIKDLRRGMSTGTIAARFHNTLVELITAVAEQTNAERVALSGGCFQNRLLLTRAAARLRASGREVLLHRLVPPNDGGVSLGQIAAAAARLERER